MKKEKIEHIVDELKSSDQKTVEILKQVGELRRIKILNLQKNSKNQALFDDKEILVYTKKLDEISGALFGQNPNNSELRYIVIYSDAYRNIAGEKLMLNYPNNSELLSIMDYCVIHRNDAWELFVSQNPSDEELRYVIQHIPSLSEIAQELYLNKEPSLDYFVYVANYLDYFIPSEKKKLKDQNNKFSLDCCIHVLKGVAKVLSNYPIAIQQESNLYDVLSYLIAIRKYLHLKITVSQFCGKANSIFF